MQSLGAEKAVDYHDSNWKNEIKDWAHGGVDAALAIQPGTGIDSIELIKDGGKLITVSGDSGQVKPERGIIIRQMGHTNMKETFQELIDGVSTGEIRLVIEKEYKFEEALEALEKTETRHARGKLVVNGLNENNISG